MFPDFEGLTRELRENIESINENLVEILKELKEIKQAILVNGSK